MDGLIKTGKLRYWGILNWSPVQIEEAWQVATAEGMAAPCAAQLAYSLLNLSPAEDQSTQELFNAVGISIVASYSLYGGLLTGKYNRPASADKSRFNRDDVEAMRQKHLLDKVDQVIALAEQVGCTPAQLALAYCLANGQVASVLFGATKVSQVAENIQALEISSRLDQEIMVRLRHLS